jgi:hypothetical protein
MTAIVNRDEWQKRASEAYQLAGALDRQRAELLAEIARLYSGLAAIEREPKTELIRV